jgi:predicted MFS family arabinose efflux permease
VQGQNGLSTLIATSLIQIVGSFAIAAPLAISIVIVRAEHLPESWIGYYTSLLYAAAIVGSVATARLLSSFSVRFVQLGALLATALGYALFCRLEPGLFPLLAACTGIVLMGIAYGVTVPSGSLALAQCYSPRAQPLVVSVRQTGVPVGTALVALIAPLMAQHFGWQSMLIPVLVAVAGAFALSLAGLRPFGAISANPPRRQHVLAALRSAMAAPATRRLAMVSGAYGVNQAALTTYLVPSLVWIHGLSVGKAAGYLAMATIAGAAARIVFGVTTARLGRARLHLGLIGLVSGIAWLLLLWPMPSPLRLTIGSIVLGMTAMGWNGILLAEMALEAPAGQTTEAVAAGTSFAYFGVLMAPLFYVVLDLAFSSRTGALAGLAVLAVLAGAWLLLTGARGSALHSSP